MYKVIDVDRNTERIIIILADDEDNRSSFYESFDLDNILLRSVYDGDTYIINISKYSSFDSIDHDSYKQIVTKGFI